MNSAETILSRPGLMLHLLRWELRRLQLPLAAWLIAALTGTLLLHFSEYPVLHQEISRRMNVVASGVVLAALMVVFLTGELFLPLSPWTVKPRYARPPRRTDTVVAAMLLHVFVVVLPFVSYLFPIFLSQPGGSPADGFLRHYLTMLCATMAFMVLAALLTGDWAFFVPVSAASLILPGTVNRMIPLHFMAIILVISLAAALAVMRWRRRWTVLGVWLTAAAATMAIWWTQRN